MGCCPSSKRSLETKSTIFALPKKCTNRDSHICTPLCVSLPDEIFETSEPWTSTPSTESTSLASPSRTPSPTLRRMGTLWRREHRLPPNNEREILNLYWEQPPRQNSGKGQDKNAHVTTSSTTSVSNTSQKKIQTRSPRLYTKTYNFHQPPWNVRNLQIKLKL